MGGGRCVTLVWHCGLSQGGHLFKCVFLFEEKSYLVSSLQSPVPQPQAQENMSEQDVITSDWPE